MAFETYLLLFNCGKNRKASGLVCTYHAAIKLRSSSPASYSLSGTYDNQKFDIEID